MESDIKVIVVPVLLDDEASEAVRRALRRRELVLASLSTEAREAIERAEEELERAALGRTPCASP